jgi:squalene-hopene/tetraprenyl-beta-curcumene cyclase
MNAFPIARYALLLLFGSFVFTAAVRAEDTGRADELKLRAALSKGLDFLGKEGDRWMNEKTCNSCHHMPLLLWSHREAKRRGFTIDDKVFNEFVDWTNERSKNTSAGADVLAYLKLAMPDNPYPELTKIITGLQQADGSWKPGNQFTGMQRRDGKEAIGNSARVFLLGLGVHAADKDATEAASAKAKALIEKSEPAKSVETLAFRTLYAKRYGTPEEVAALRTEIARLQHADGGWGWMIADERSDALGTGEALYALQLAPEPSMADAIARAQRWLLEHQRADGGWAMDITCVSKVDRSAPDKAKSLKAATEIYTFWGSAWATIGLLEGVPVAGKSR